MSRSPEKGGEALLRKIEARLGDPFKGLFETADVPYTMYQIFKGTELIGYIHGVNQKGQYGGIQVFLALDLRRPHPRLLFPKADQSIRQAPARSGIRETVRRAELHDFDDYDVACRNAKPGVETRGDSKSRARSGRRFPGRPPRREKNLILCDVFLLGGASSNISGIDLRPDPKESS